MQALVKFLLYFIARGHKATAFLPILFDERSDELCCDRCALVSNTKQFLFFILLKSIKFLPSKNFASQIKHRPPIIMEFWLPVQKHSILI